MHNDKTLKYEIALFFMFIILNLKLFVLNHTKKFRRTRELDFLYYKIDGLRSNIDDMKECLSQNREIWSYVLLNRVKTKRNEKEYMSDEEFQNRMARAGLLSSSKEVKNKEKNTRFESISLFGVCMLE